MDNEKINEILKKQEEMLQIIRKMWRMEKWRRIGKIVKFVIFIGIIVGAFYFVEPYVERYLGLIKELQNIRGPEELQNILEQLQ